MYATIINYYIKINFDFFFICEYANTQYDIKITSKLLIFLKLIDFAAGIYNESQMWTSDCSGLFTVQMQQIRWRILYFIFISIQLNAVQIARYTLLMSSTGVISLKRRELDQKSS